MMRWLRELDRLLRGEHTTPSKLAAGTQHLPLGPLIGVSVLLAVLYGECMGAPSLVNRADPQYLQMLASGLKVPALFFLTVLVTFPSLYVFCALLGVPLRASDTVRVIVAALAIDIAVLASFALITLFFTFCTDSYLFMTLLNVAFFAVAGFFGLGFLVRILKRIESAREDQDSELPANPGATRQVFFLWLMLFGLVGMQMAWVLRPFIGNPNAAFEWFRPREGNFFIAVGTMLLRVLGL